MSKVSELNDTLTNLDQKYFEAKKALEDSRLEAALTDAAQAIADRDKPGSVVNDVMINTDPTYTIETMLDAFRARIEQLTAEVVQLKAELSLVNKDNGSREA